MSKFEREMRYLVFKLTDVSALSHADQMELYRIGSLIESNRVKAGKKPLVCVLVESDWPEYEPTWAAIQQRVLST